MVNVEEIKTRLRRREIDEASLHKLAEAVAALDGQGFPSKDVFPLGIIIQEGAGASFEVAPERLGELIGEIAKLGDLRPEIRVFPIGIVAPDTFEVRATIGRVSR